MDDLLSIIDRLHDLLFGDVIGPEPHLQLIDGPQAPNAILVRIVQGANANTGGFYHSFEPTLG